MRNRGVIDVVAVLSVACLALPAIAADWVPIKRDGDTVKEIDRAGATRNGSVVSFTARHVFPDEGESTGERKATKYMMMVSRMDCAKKTVTHVSAEAYDAKMTLVSKQSVPPMEMPIPAGSVDDSVFQLLCAEGGAKSK